MTLYIVLAIIYIIGVGLFGTMWENNRYGYRDHWYQNASGYAFTLLWFIIVPLLGLYMIGKIAACAMIILGESIFAPRKRRH